MVLKLRYSLAALLSATSSLALVTPNIGLRDLGVPLPRRADTSLTGYLGAFFLGDEPDVYFYLSEGNDAVSFTALNGGSPVIVPTVGTGGVRDPAIVTGGGDEAGQKWYIVGTDLDISKVCLPPFLRVQTGHEPQIRCLSDIDVTRQHGTHHREPALEVSSSGRART